MKMFVPLAGEEKIDWNGATLVLPCVSVGNVGQLAADLLISTLELQKVGRLHSECALPVVGNDPFSEKSNKCSLMTAIEVYGSKKDNLVVVQQRSPIIGGKKKMFVDQLTAWVKECQFKKVVVLTSSHAHERLDSQLIGCQLRYLASEELQNDLSNISLRTGEKIQELEKRKLLNGADSSSNSQNSDLIFIPGGGIAKSFFNRCVEEKIPIGIILEFCAEGDNIPEAIQLGTAAVDLLQKTKSTSIGNEFNWKMPPSWKLMYGNRFEQVLYR